jgi:ferredoxin
MSARAKSAPAATAQISVEWTRCDGHGLCAALLPGRVELDEWGFPIVRRPGVAPQDEDDARRAVAACPALALRLEPTR